MAFSIGSPQSKVKDQITDPVFEQAHSGQQTSQLGMGGIPTNMTSASQLGTPAQRKLEENSIGFPSKKELQWRRELLGKEGVVMELEEDLLRQKNILLERRDDLWLEVDVRREVRELGKEIHQLRKPLREEPLEPQKQTLPLLPQELPERRGELKIDPQREVAKLQEEIWKLRWQLKKEPLEPQGAVPLQKKEKLLQQQTELHTQPYEQDGQASILLKTRRTAHAGKSSNTGFTEGTRVNLPREPLILGVD